MARLAVARVRATAVEEVRAVRGRTSKPAVFQITGVRRGMSADIQARQRRYVASMLFRTACFIGVIFTHGPLRFVLFLGALLLPYIAVVVANAGRERPADPPTTQLLGGRAALGDRPATADADGDADADATARQGEDDLAGAAERGGARVGSPPNPEART